MYKIIMVDNDPTSLAIGQALLDEEYEMTLARSGMQALGYLNAEILPDLILLDMVMLGFSGMEFLKKLKNTERLKDIPVIFLTAETQKERIIALYENGAADFLEKPVNSDLLRIKLRQHLENVRIRRENQKLKSNLKLLRERFDELFPSETGD